MALAALSFHLATAPVAYGSSIKIGEDTDPTRTLTMDSKPKDWEEVIKPILVQREQQIAEAKAAEAQRQKEAAQKAAAEEAARQKAAQQQTPVQPAPAISGSKTDWMRAAGIPESLWGYVDYIVTRESGWRPTAVNRSSGATGLCQSLPASKMSSAGADYLTNPVTQLRWCDSYAKARYGGWANAYSFWIAKHWW